MLLPAYAIGPFVEVPTPLTEGRTQSKQSTITNSQHWFNREIEIVNDPGRFIYDQ
jgi:hypothetical protein